VFDSYHKEAEDSENSLYESDGITIDHIMSSGTVPEFYDFRDIGGRKFCDGGLLSNTPFRELLQIHQIYWMSKGKGIVPDLEVYIVNVHPSKQLGLAEDHDGVRDRINDITFLDRNSYYDENVANTETDYMQLIDKLKGLAESCISKDKIGSFTSEFNNFLMTEAKSKSHTGKRRTYQNLLDGRFKLIKVIRIEPTHYTDSIYGKGSDFTSETIKGLIQKGTVDAINALNP
jgi:NTE family protein